MVPPDSSTETITLDPNPSPTKRPKTDPYSTIDFRFDDDDITLPRCCGLCLSEEGTTIRGHIDCCDHYYCFLCIIDWAKIESRCPLCKCRFHGIRRVRRDGSEIGEREVVVPIRDQISNPDIDREESDPHAHVRCTVCHDSKDESLLLLCDLCDTAAHTYCVGLGVTVPEGDWFCEDCVTVRAELSNHETRAGISLPTTPCPTKGVPPAKVQVSVFDIIKEPQEPRTSKIHRLLRWTNPRKCRTLSTISSNSADLGFAGEGRPAAKEFLNSRDKVVDSDVTVPNGCQNTYQNMRDLRENWASFQCGTMCFSSSTLGASGKSSISLDAMSTDGSFVQASLPKENITCNKAKQQCDVHKAWKLLKSAMSMQQAEKQHQASKVVSKTPLKKIGSSNKSKKSILDHTASKSLPSKFKDQGSTRLKKRGDTSGGFLCERSEKEQHVSARQYGTADPTNDLVLSSSEPQKQFLASIHHEQASIESDGEVNRVSSNTRFRFNEFPSLGTSAGLMGKFTSNPSKLQRTSLPCTNAEYPEAVEKGHQTCSDINSRQDGDPKAEIQSLVKLNLKILTSGKRLRANEFKDIARHSTHVILEACGLKPQESGKHAVLPSICKHNKGTEPPRRYTLMLTSCRECFYVYVMDVVRSATSEKLGHG